MIQNSEIIRDINSQIIEKSKLAVIMPVYNAEKFLREAVDSVLHQTWSDFHFFACNDGSTDSSLAILNEYAAADKRVTVLCNPQNSGIVATRNHLLSKLPEDVKFVAIIDADDVCYPDRFERQIAFLQAHPEIGGVGSSLDIIDENSRSTGFRSYPCDPAQIRKTLPRVNVLANPAMMVRKELIDQTGQYSTICPVAQDYEYWLRAIEKFDFANLPEPVLHYRISGNQAKQSKLKLTLRKTLEIQRNYYSRNKKRMPLSGVIYHIACRMLLLLPSQWILKLFVFLTYRRSKKTE